MFLATQMQLVLPMTAAGLGETAGLQLHNGRVSLLQLLSQPWRQRHVDSWRCCRKTLGKPMGKWWFNGKIHHSSWENSPFQLGHSCHSFNSYVTNYQWVRAKSHTHLQFKQVLSTVNASRHSASDSSISLVQTVSECRCAGETRSTKG